MLLIHICIALLSLFSSGYMSFSPSTRKLHITYILTAATLTSGIYLVITTPFHMLSICLDGLFYIGIIVTAVFFAKRKLASKKIQ